MNFIPYREPESQDGCTICSLLDDTPIVVREGIQGGNGALPHHHYRVQSVIAGYERLAALAMARSKVVGISEVRWTDNYSEDEHAERLDVTAAIASEFTELVAAESELTTATEHLVSLGYTRHQIEKAGVMHRMWFDTLAVHERSAEMMGEKFYPTD